MAADERKYCTRCCNIDHNKTTVIEVWSVNEGRLRL